MFPGHYSNPSGFCFDIACTDEPINDNPKLQGYNVEERVGNPVYLNFFPFKSFLNRRLQKLFRFLNLPTGADISRYGN